MSMIPLQHNAILSFSDATESQLKQVGNATGNRSHDEAIRVAASALSGKSI